MDGSGAVKFWAAEFYVCMTCGTKQTVVVDYVLDTLKQHLVQQQKSPQDKNVV